MKILKKICFRILRNIKINIGRVVTFNYIYKYFENDKICDKKF